jgi:hypothetical protein
VADGRAVSRSVVAVLVALIAGAAPAARQPEPGLFVSAPAQAASTPADASVVRQRAVTIDAARLDAATVVLNLFDDAEFTAVLDRRERTSTGYVLGGRLRNIENSAVTLAVTADVMAGSITMPDASYAIRHGGDGIHFIQQINPARLPPELPPVRPPDMPAAEAPVSVAADDGSQIDLLVVYTPSARAAQGGTSSIEALIDVGVSDTNQAYANSGVVQRLRLVNKQEIAYTEFGSMLTDLNRLTETSDGFMDAVHALRNAHGADLVQLIVNSPGSCGVAWLMTTNSTSFAPFAFGVTHYTCIAGNYSFSHEMAHNMGLHHDAYMTGSETGVFAYSRGYVNQMAFVGGAPTNKRWRDIMSYVDQCSAAGFVCSRILYFSNLSATFTDDVMGLAASADGARSLNETRTAVANFRAAIAITEFTDPVLTSGVTMIKAVHIDELRTRINAVRTARGLGAQIWTDDTLTAGSSVIRAVHVEQMRTALAEAYTHVGLMPPTYSAPAVATGVAVMAAAISELRAAVIALE